MTTARASTPSDPPNPPDSPGHDRDGDQPGDRPHARAGTKGVPRAHREQQILDAALEEFGRRGHAAASMAEIATRVGVTKPLLYTYFGSKDGLYAACVDDVGPRLLTAIEESMTARGATSGSGEAASGSGEEGLPYAVLTALFRALEGRRHAWFVLYDRTLRPGSEPWRAARRHREAVDGLAATGTAALLRAQGNDDALDADALKHLWTGTVGALIGWWIAHPELSAEDMSARCARLLAAVRIGA
ncbi:MULTISPECIES: helix-turn-helix domain-containing protein [Streptomyces]|uniref:TetR/AcrR family transcriptional regulator n=1 Tax=Streptomyces TaxID=1883 RepID=UPI0029C07302|nr:helix-turn-helix domain-containing protein [Streptomyces sp. WI03-4A]